MDSDLAYSAIVLMVQAGPLPLEFSWSDTGKQPVHGLLVYENQTRTLTFHEFNADYTAHITYPMALADWGRVGCPGHIEILLLDERRITLLRDQAKVPQSYLRLLQNRKHVEALLKTMTAYVKLGQERAAALRRRLSWQEMSDIWHGMELPETETLRREITHTEADFQALFESTAIALNEMQASKLSTAEGASIRQFLTELSSKVDRTVVLHSRE